MGEFGNIGTFYPAELATANKLEADKSASNRTRLNARTINDIKKTIAALTLELGINPAGNATDVKTRLNQIEGSIINSITATSAGVAASLDIEITLVTTNGDADEDNVTVADPGGTNVGKKIFIVNVTSGDTLKFTPNSLAGSETKISFADGVRNKGFAMAWDPNDESWIIYANNGGTIA